MAIVKETYSAFRHIITELDGGNLAPSYFASGSDYYLYQGFVKALKGAFSSKYGANADLVQRWGVELKSVPDVTTLLGGGGLFSSASLVMLHEIQGASTSVKTKLADLFRNLPPDTTVLIHYSAEEGRKAKWLDALQRVGQSVPLRQPAVAQLPGIVAEMARVKGLTMDQAAVLRLIELTSGELAIIHNEIEKIVLFLDEDQKHVSQQVVDTVAGSIENAHVYQFIDAVSRRDRESAMRTLIEIHHQGKEGLPFLVALMYNRLTQLMALQETPEARKSINRESTSAYFLRDLGSVARNYSLPELQMATRHLAELDIAFRLGSVDLLTSFSTWIAKVL